MGVTKKKVLIVNNNLVSGGVQRSLVNLIKQVKKDYDITLFLFSKSGEYVKNIPTDVKIIEAAPLLKILGLSQGQTKHLGYGYFFIRALLVLFTKFFSNHLPITMLMLSQKRLVDYDIAISFLHNADEKSFYGGCNEFVLQRVKAKKKITFIHCDFLKYGGNTVRNRNLYKQFDKIATVSNGCRESFVKAVPELSEKTYCVYNCHNHTEYVEKSKINTIEYAEGCINIVTVARLTPEKGLLRALQVIKKLVTENYQLCWHIIGDGSQKSEIEKQIQDNDLSKHIILYGNQENPYSYIRNADLFLLPSFHEAAPMVFEEAKCLGVPIITTNTISAHEMVKQNIEGLVCENNEKALFDTIKQVLNEPFFIETCKDYLQNQSYSNEIASKQFHQLMR